MKYNYFENIEVSSSIDDAINKGITEAVSKKRRKRVKNIAITCSLTIIIIVSTVFYNDKVLADVKEAFWSIASYFGLDNDLGNYKTVINKPITDNGYTIKLNEVVLDKKELIISSTMKSETGPFNGYPEVSKNIYINGKKIMANSNGVSESGNSYTQNYIDTYFLDEELSGEVNIKVEYLSINLMDDTGAESIKGSWVFDFKTDTDSLANNTMVKKLDKSFKFENGQSIKLKEYISNSLGSKIEFEQGENGTDYGLKLVGSDNLGNPIEFYNSYSSGSYGLFKLDNSVGNIKKEATQLKLCLYILDSDSVDKWEKTGSEFVVDIK
ncbi:MAG: DUF4179 domain-containing protein [Paeniclostridium sordellii]|nr:DUF4179 domain-containing protein [Paeniclostridium sordellii]